MIQVVIHIIVHWFVLIIYKAIKKQANSVLDSHVTEPRFTILKGMVLSISLYANKIAL